MSALILIAHVKNGVEIARENKLGQVDYRHHPAAPRHQSDQLFL
jgi:membrane-associated HD superfamily phosphohydrolase